MPWHTCKGERTPCGSWFSPSTFTVVRIQLRSPGLYPLNHLNQFFQTPQIMINRWEENQDHKRTIPSNFFFLEERREGLSQVGEPLCSLQFHFPFSRAPCIKVKEGFENHNLIKSNKKVNQMPKTTPQITVLQRNQTCFIHPTQKQ